MKVTVTMKTPYALLDAVNAAVRTEEQDPVVGEPRRDELLTLCGRWFHYGEYINVEIDTEAGTCVVLPREGK